jgi:hypothetical protein
VLKNAVVSAGSSDTAMKIGYYGKNMDFSEGCRPVRVLPSGEKIRIKVRFRV